MTPTPHSNLPSPPPNSPPRPVNALTVLKALEEQVACYRALAKLAGRQHEYVQNDQTEELIGVLTERAGVLDRVTELEAVVGPAKKDWAAFTGALPDAIRKRAEAMMAETRSLLAEITAGDERDALALQQRKLRIGNEIKATTSAVSVNRNYAANAYGRSKSSVLDHRT